jgi:uncharacterized protein YegP (UPF0339 family)
MNKYIVRQNSTKEWYFVLTAKNGQVIVVSTPCTSKIQLMNKIESLKSNVYTEEIVYENQSVE